MTDIIQLGVGVLTWRPEERRSDRYGAVFLMNDGNTSLVPDGHIDQLDATGLKVADGCYGSLIATVLDPRKSTHLGDIFRGVFPSVPMLGESIVLGTGHLFAEHDLDACRVGLYPLDGRTVDWLDIRALYRAHEQLVRLEFWPDSDLETLPPESATRFDPDGATI